MGVILAIQLTLNIAGINLVALLNQISVWWHIGIVAIVVVLIFLTGKPDQSGLTLFQIQPQDQAGSWNNNLGFLNLQYGPATTLSGHHRVLLLPAPGQLDVHRL